MLRGLPSFYAPKGSVDGYVGLLQIDPLGVLKDVGSKGVGQCLLGVLKITRKE